MAATLTIHLATGTTAEASRVFGTFFSRAVKVFCTICALISLLRFWHLMDVTPGDKLVSIRSGLAACGVLAVLAAAGCGSGGSGDAGAAPTWVAGLGPGVTLEAPTSQPTKGTPQATVYSYMHELTSSTVGRACGYLIKSSQMPCLGGMYEAVEQGINISYSYKSFDLGYAAVDGAQALVGTTYTQLCRKIQTRTCSPDNADPAALLDSGKSFAELWTQAQHANSSEYFLFPCVEVDGTWYIDEKT
jgi:hypothetical protein